MLVLKSIFRIVFFLIGICLSVYSAPSAALAAHHVDSHSMNPSEDVNCQKDDFCPLKKSNQMSMHKQHPVAGGESGELFHISCDCGGNSSSKATSKSHSRDGLVTLANLQDTSFHFFPHSLQKEFPLAGFPSGLKRPPQCHSS